MFSLWCIIAPNVTTLLCTCTLLETATVDSLGYSKDGHDGDPSSPPQEAPMVSTGLNSTSVTITLLESNNSCKPYHVWIAGIAQNGQQGPYSERRQVEVCKACRGEHETMT